MVVKDLLDFVVDDLRIINESRELVNDFSNSNSFIN